MKTFLSIILILHVCAAIDWTITFNGFYDKHAKLAEISEKVGLLWSVQSAINLLILVVLALAIFNDEDELRAALYRITLSERGKNEDFDRKIDGIVAYKESTKTPGEPAWATKMCFSGIAATLAIWLLALIH